MKAVCIVAHPDDCVIFAWPFMDYFDQFEWSILYLTYDDKSARGKELKDFWNKRNINVVFLGHNDTYQDMIENRISFDIDLAQTQILTFSDKFDLILTHDQHGDYGHIHHKFVHAVAQKNNIAKVFFANDNEHNFSCLRSVRLDLNELPLHKSVIAEFANIDLGKYFITEQARELLDGKI